MKATTWAIDSIQFARLICEINATQPSLAIDVLADAMDLEVSEVCDLFDMANTAWERAKADHDL